MATSLGTSYAMAEGGILGNAHADELDLSQTHSRTKKPCFKNVFSDLAPETNHSSIPESALPTQKLPDNIIDNASIPKMSVLFLINLKMIQFLILENPSLPFLINTYPSTLLSQFKTNT